MLFTFECFLDLSTRSPTFDQEICQQCIDTTCMERGKNIMSGKTKIIRIEEDKTSIRIATAMLALGPFLFSNWVSQFANRISLDRILTTISVTFTFTFTDRPCD